MKKKGLYYARIHSQDPVNLGAVKKCHGLMNGFRQLGYEMDIVWYGEAGVLFNEEVIFRFPFSTDSGALRNILFHHLLFDGAIARKVDFREYGFMFVRYPLAHPGFIRFLKKAKSTNPALRIFLEVPTYPYKKEFSTPLRKMQYWLDQRCSRFLKKYVDWTVHYGAFESLFGIPSIAIQNGVDIGAISVSQSVPKHGLLRLIAMGNWNHWHGLDRLIEGLSKYYQGEKKEHSVVLTIAGGGKEVKTFQRMAKERGLDQVIHFSPPLEGVNLDQVFKDTDICIGSLGLSRLGLLLASPLKHREYCARGLPMVLATPDPDFSSDLSWVFYAPDDESPISISNLILFFESCYKEDIHKDIRKYADEHLGWDKVLKQIVEMV